MPPPCKSGVLHDGLGVPNLDWQAATPHITAIVLLVVRLSDGKQAGADWVANIRGVLLV